MGELSVVSGRVLACDPFAPDELVPFERSLRPGTYPVTVTLADTGEETLVAFAALLMEDAERITRWTMATRPGERLEELGEGDIYGYPVDSGAGCFVDSAAASMLHDDGYVSSLVQQYDAARREGWSAFAEAARPQDDRASIAVFSSGTGDGVYASYFGFSERGEVAALVTVFDVVDTENIRPHSNEGAAWWHFWRWGR